MFDNIFNTIWVIGFIAGSVIRAIYKGKNRDNKIIADNETVTDMLLLVLAGIGMIVIPLLYLLTPWLKFADYNLPEWAGWMGAAVFVIALWLLWRSHAEIGRNWSAKLEIKEDHSLITKGVYRYVRHPMYAAHWIWGIAQALLLENWVAGMALLVFFVPLYLVRVPREEHMMIEQFGEKYQSYMNRTGRIIPHFPLQKQG